MHRSASHCYLAGARFEILLQVLGPALRFEDLTPLKQYSCTVSGMHALERLLSMLHM
jgi:hypothetical protein